MNLVNFDLNETFRERTGYIVKDKYDSQAEMLEEYGKRERLLDEFTNSFYLEVLEFAKGKTYLEILPKDLVSKKKSLIKSYIINTIESTYEYLLKSRFYNDTPITKEQIALYMMIGTAYSNFQLSYLIIPKVYDFEVWNEYYEATKELTLTDQEAKVLRDKFRETNRELIDSHYELDRKLQYLSQVWKSYLDRLMVKKGLPTASYDIEDDGYPRTSRGNMCYLFIGVKDFEKIPEDSTEIKLYNPRTKKNVTFTGIEFKPSDKVFSAIDSKGKRVFFADYKKVAEAYDCLFDINKAIYSGWWNKVLEFKK